MENLILLRPSDEYAGEVMDFRAEMLQNGDSLWADFAPRLRARYGDGYVP